MYATFHQLFEYILVGQLTLLRNIYQILTFPLWSSLEGNLTLKLLGSGASPVTCKVLRAWAQSLEATHGSCSKHSDKVGKEGEMRGNRKKRRSSIEFIYSFAPQGFFNTILFGDLIFKLLLLRNTLHCESEESVRRHFMGDKYFSCKVVKYRPI